MPPSSPLEKGGPRRIAAFYYTRHRILPLIDRRHTTGTAPHPAMSTAVVEPQQSILASVMALLVPTCVPAPRDAMCRRCRARFVLTCDRRLRSVYADEGKEVATQEQDKEEGGDDDAEEEEGGAEGGDDEEEDEEPEDVRLATGGPQTPPTRHADVTL